MTKLPATLLTITALTASIFSATVAEARDGSWARHHPRQTQVLARTHHQMHRINHERREGDLSGAEARDLRQSTRAIAGETRADAKANGGYITRAQQRGLNQQLNANSRAIGH